MDILKKVSERVIGATDMSIKRYLYDEIDFDTRLIILKGARGVGKTTLMLQYLKSIPRVEERIFLSLDHFIFSEERLIMIIDRLYEEGYRYFALDEVHKYPDWSIEVKNIYDSYPDLHLILTASSALDIMRGMADLSRRADVYELYGLSFREYLHFEYDIRVAPISYGDLIVDHVAMANELVAAHPDVLRYFHRYLSMGYYPFYLESRRKYHDRIRSVVSQVIEVDLPPIFSIDYVTVRQLKKLLSVISRIAPFSPNVSKLSKELSIGRNRILHFIDYLDSAALIHVLKSARKSDSVMAKPDKIYLNNANLVHAMSLDSPNVGTIRETFLMNALSVTEKVSTPIRGDFMINETHIAEVGGKSKTTHQIHGVPNAFLVKDGIEVGYSGAVPLWMFGMMY